VKSKSSAYTIAMGESRSKYQYLQSLLTRPVVLDPKMKLSHFRDHWGSTLTREIEDDTQKIVCQLLA
jgi:hypothetical protein